MIALLTIEDLLKEVEISESMLAVMLREEDIYELAGCFDCVDSYLSKLGLTAGQQTQVEELALRRDIQTAMMKALQFWCQPNPFRATYKALLEILLSLKRGDVAKRICQYIRDNANSN